MSDFILYQDDRTDYTLVSNIFLDEYMPSANGEYVKIYLYLLRCLKTSQRELSLSVIADKFEHTESDVKRALKYWEKMKLLKLEYNNSKVLSGIQLLGGPDAKPAEAPRKHLKSPPLLPHSLKCPQRLRQPLLSSP